MSLQGFHDCLIATVRMVFLHRFFVWNESIFLLIETNENAIINSTVSHITSRAYVNEQSHYVEIV